MAQPPFLVDVLQIEPGSGQTLTISRRASDGSLKFIDTVVASGLTLSQLSGIRNVTGVYVVGRGGSGAAYTTIQAALDAVPDSSSVAAPSLIMVLPGAYSENLILQKDGMYLVGLGGVQLTNDGESDTLVISASLDAVPKDILLLNLNITNDENAKCCVKILGADSFASGTVTVEDAPLATGDTITIDGNVLTGVAGTRTSGSDNFSVSGGTVAAIAAEIVAAINDAENSFADILEASSDLGVVTVTATTAGSDGNSITLATDTDPADNLTVSGATLEGGGSADNLVGSGKILIDNCHLVAEGVGGYQVLVETVNKVVVRGGTFEGSSSTSISQASNTALFSIEGSSWINDVNLTYDTDEDQPEDTTCVYRLSASLRVRDIALDLRGTGSLMVSTCPEVRNIVAGGTESLVGLNSNFNNLTLSGTLTTTLKSCTRNTATVDAGDPTLSESLTSGTLSFDDSNSEIVTFDIPGPDANYRVALDSPTTSAILAVTAKDSESFTVEASDDITGTVGWIMVRNIS